MAPFLDQTLLQNTPKAYSAFSIDGLVEGVPFDRFWPAGN
jgi:hypothetical protein